MAAAEAAVVARKKARQNERMKPVDAPRGSLRWHLVQLMLGHSVTAASTGQNNRGGALPSFSFLSLDGHGDRLKRCASELLLALCDDDLDELTARAGYGAAVYMMHVRGAVKLGQVAASQQQQSAMKQRQPPPPPPPPPPLDR